MSIETAAVSSKPRQKILRAIRDNPVVLKELRGRMRGARAFTVLTIYLGLLGAFTSLIYAAMSESSMSMSGQLNVGEVGRTLFAGIVAIEMLLVSFIAPAFTAGAISGEREHQTYDLLRTTLLPPYLLVLGKLLAAILYTLLLLLAAVPLQSIAFFFGGVAETEVFLSFVILALTALLFSTIGLYFSARSRRTLSASVLTYALAAFISFGLPLIVGSILLILGPSWDLSQSSRAQIALIYLMGLVVCTNPAATAWVTQYVLVNQRTIGTFTINATNSGHVTLISPWIPFTVLYLGLSVIFFVLAVRRVRRIQE